MKTHQIVIAPDSFKGSASSIKIASAIESGILRVNAEVKITKYPIADGGEGTVEALVTAKKGEIHEVEVTGPLGEPVQAKLGILDEDTAIIEMAEASGLILANENKNPFKTTTYGTGELIKYALNHGAKTIYVGLGGSATNDGGMGMAQALGVSFKDSNNQELGFGAEALSDLQTINTEHLDPRIKDVKIIALSDVNNPLTGENGASYIYGLQKGAKEEDLEVLDSLLKKLEDRIGFEIANLEGAGAAGGLGAGLIAFTNATIQPGINSILKMLDIEKDIKNADLVITGEGQIDNQSLNGKVPIGIAQLAKNYNKPVIAIVGSSSDDHSKIHEVGIDLVIETINKPMNLETAIKNWEPLVELAGMKAYYVLSLLGDKNEI